LKRFAIILAVLLAASAVGNCKNTKLVASVKAPDYVPQHFKKVLIIGMSDNTEVRLDFEDAMAAALKREGIHAVPGHNILLRPKHAKMDPAYLKAQIKEHQIDAVMVSRLVSETNETTYIPGQAYAMPFPYYNSFYGYYGNVYPVVYTPGYLLHESKVRVETTLYGTSTPEGEFVWTGLSETVDPNPKKAQKAINGLVDVVVKDLEKEGIFDVGTAQTAAPK
jgi:hypothetical protein